MQLDGPILKIAGGSFTLGGMQTRVLGKTGLDVSAVGFGGWAIGGNAFGNSYGPTEDAESLAALNRAYERGCTFFDTADHFGHGHGETLLGQALKGWKREEIVIATQGGMDVPAGKPNFSDTHLRRAVDASLQRLGVEAIDVYTLHHPPLALIQHGQVFDVLRELKRAGKIRFFGVSIHDPQEGVQAIRIGQVDVVQAVYNLFDRRIEKQLIDACAETGTGLVIREPLARGFLAGTMPDTITFEPGDTRAVWPRPLVQKRLQAAERFRPVLPPGCESLAQLAIAWPLAQTAVSAVIPGCKTVAQTEENMAVGDWPPLPTETREAIRQVQEAL